MLRFLSLWLPALLFWAGCSTPEPPSAARPKPPPPPPPPPPAHFAPRTVPELQHAAAHFHSVVNVPVLESSPERIQRTLTNVMARGGAALNEISSCAHDHLTFENTFIALDDLRYETQTTLNRLTLIRETSTNAALRDAATEATKTLAEWSVGMEYREGVYGALLAYAKKLPKLWPEEEKLLKDTLRDFRRAGLTMPPADRQEVENWRKELSRLLADFAANITKAQASVVFTAAELEGVPAEFLNAPGIKTAPDAYTIRANVTDQFQTVMDNARKEDTRRKLAGVQLNLASVDNTPLLQRIVELRDRIARKLGYPTWADYQIEPKMARDAATVREFLDRLESALQPKFAGELQEFRKLKEQDTGEANARIEIWDWRYYSNQLKKQKFAVDAEQLRVYFPYEQVRRGMFEIYETIFGLKIGRIDAPAKWAADVELYAVWDAETAEPLGLFYLDMFPREGKYHHFAQFPLIEGKRLPRGLYQRPTVALICNFRPPTAEQPSLLSHAEVETFFHEFGHALHSILTRAQFGRFSGTSVPRDFVEAPSQMFENWVWDKRVLDRFAADYRDHTKRIPKRILARLKEAKLATIGTYYRRQLALALTDLALHTQVRDGTGPDCVQVANGVMARVFLAPPENTAFVAYFGHLEEYDAGYYGYAWANAIAADLATVFEKAPHGFLDAKAGKHLREEIYALGDSRDVNISIEKFLGRPRSLDPFFKSLGSSGR
jgi:thimet oligopeptidase